jgi:hypothetical protein
MAANYGYCCINLTLDKQKGIKIGRSMIKKTFQAKVLNTQVSWPKLTSGI